MSKASIRQMEWQKRQKEKGLCIACREPAVDGYRCVKHKQANLDGVKRYLAKKRAAAKLQAAPVEMPAPVEPQPEQVAAA